MWTRMEGGCVSEPVARSPIEPPPPVLVVEGWEVSGRRARAALTLTDCTPLAKLQVRAPIGGRAAAELAVPFGRAVRDPGGTLVAGSGPGEWLLLAAPGRGPALAARMSDLAACCPGALVTATDVTRDDTGGVPSYLLHCERSSGAYLFGELLAAGGELGIDIDGFTTDGFTTEGNLNHHLRT